MSLFTAAILFLPFAMSPAPGSSEAASPSAWTSPPAAVFEVTTDDGGPSPRVEEIARGPEAISISPRGDRFEWLFERNAVDPRRVTGYRIEHAERRIVVYDESELRSRLGIAGFSDVVAPGLRPALLEGLRSTGEREEASGVVFERRVGPEGESNGVVDVWWSEAVLLPLRLTVKSPRGRVTTRMEKLSLGFTSEAAAGRLGDPRRRFPDYEVVEVSDLGDRHP